MGTRCIVCETEADNENVAECGFCGTPFATVQTVGGALPQGSRLHGGDLALGRVLGIGGFGITYLGVDLQLHRLVAIKEFFPYGSMREGTLVRHGDDLSASAFTAARDRFLHEARVAARFQQPGIVRVYSFFEENDTAYMVMELLRGETLHDLVERRGPLPEPEAVGYIAQVAASLEAVHEAGFIHRDLKPDNIFLTAEGRVVLLDFGTAKALVPKHHPVTAFVSPGYTPPEQYLTGYTPDPRSDVYALAATLYHLLTATMPVEASARTAGRPLPELAVINPGIRRPVAEAIHEALALDVSQRPPTITAFLARLRGESARTSGVAAPAPPSAVVFPNGAPQRLRPISMMRGHGGFVRSVDFAPRAEWLISGSEDKTIRVWGVQSHEEHAQLGRHDGWIACVCVSPDGSVLATASYDKTVRLWDLERRNVLCVMRGEGGALSVAFAPDGSKLCGSFINGVVVLWDREGRELARTPAIKESIWSVAFSPDGVLLAFGTWTTPYLQLWDVPRWRDAGRIAGQTSGIRSVAWSPDGRTIATASRDRWVSVWDVEKRAEVARLEGHRGGVNAVAFHPSGRCLASAGTDKTLRLWDLDGGHLLQVVEAHGGEVMSVSFSRDGRYLATGSQDERVGLFAVEAILPPGATETQGL